MSSVHFACGSTCAPNDGPDTCATPLLEDVLRVLCLLTQSTPKICKFGKAQRNPLIYHKFPEFHGWIWPT